MKSKWGKNEKYKEKNKKFYKIFEYEKIKI